MRRPGSGRQIWPPWVSPAKVMWKSPGAVPFTTLGVVREQQAQHAGPAVEPRQHRRQVVVAAVGVVDAGDLDGRPAGVDALHLVGQQAHAALRDDRGVDRPHERRLAVAVVVVAQHAEDAQRRPQAQELPPELVEPGRAAGEVAGDDHEVRLAPPAARSTALRVARRLRLGVKPAWKSESCTMVRPSSAAAASGAGRRRSTRRTHWASCSR